MAGLVPATHEDGATSFVANESIGPRDKPRG
jgi:hypothetical protein